jgi:transcriptional regulator with PAS, ATPase and Fis domain
VAASNKNLADLVTAGPFRQDLYYRINVVRIALPPLRERREDLPLLVEHFIARFNRLREREIAGVASETLGILLAHDYPGNIRELENIIEYAFILCTGGLIYAEHLPEPLRPTPQAVVPAGVTTLHELEARFIHETLRRHAWNRGAAARELGIHKTTLWRKIRQLGITIPAE